MSLNQPANVPDNAALLVACLCAQWCNTCNDYRAPFEQLQAEFPTLKFVWVDIEDEADLVDPIEVENFPTLLLARQSDALFFGTVTPHLETLKRLIQSHLAPDTRPIEQEQAGDLARRLQERF
jgi:thiol-disulfide isomerase/thioredoxin